MNCARVTAMAMAAAAGLMAAVAPAWALPAVLDRVPEDAIVAVAVPNFAGLKKDLADLGTQTGLPIGVLVEQAMGMAGVEQGLKADGSLAIIMPNMTKAEAEAAEEPPLIVLVPTTGYAQLVEGLGSKAGAAGGLDAVTVSGEPMFSKDIGGGYAALSASKSTLEAFTGKEGSGAALTKLAGPRADALADRSDVVIAINVPRLRPLAEEAVLQGLKQQAEQMAAMAPGAGASMVVPEWAIRNFFEQTRFVIAGASIDGKGVSLDLAMAFGEGTSFGKASEASGKAAALTGKLPGGAYLFTAALDLSNPAFKALVREVGAMTPEEAPAAQKASAASWLAMLEHLDGSAMSIGFVPGGLMSGLFSAGVSYLPTSKPEVVAAEFRKGMEAMGAADVATVKYTEGGQEIDGRKVDVYEARLKPDAGNPMAGQAGMMMFGPAGGPSGYVAKVDGGVVTTLSKNSALMTTAIKAAAGQGGLLGDQVTGQVAGMLPEGRVAEIYLGSKALIDTVMPLMGMFMGVQANLDIPQDLPPVAASLAPGQGTMIATIYVPAPTIKTFVALGEQIQAGMGGVAPEQGGDVDNEMDGKGAGQPGF